MSATIRIDPPGELCKRRTEAPRRARAIRLAASFLRRPSILLPAALWIAAAPLETRAADDLFSLDFRRVVREAKQKVFPTVVFIRAIRETLQDGRASLREISGSGVLIGAGGELLTNWHVIDKAVEIRCLLHDGRAMAATIVGSDKDLDLALLQLRLPDDAAPLPFAVLGDSERLREGDFVMAMGAPWGLTRSVSIGIISCAHRYLPHRSEYNLWLQTDASISPGNSGGPLVNTDGEVIGINTLGTLIGGDTGFAIPASVIAQVLPAFRLNGRIEWSYTGLEPQPLTDFNRNIYFDADEGFMVASTDPDSPARAAGFRTGDRIVKIDAYPVTGRSEEDLPDIRRRLGLLPKNTPVNLTLMRGDERMTLALTAIEKGSVEGEELDCPRWDFTAKSINRFHTPELFFFRTEGVFVFGVRRPGNAQMAGLQPRDIILEIDGRPVNTLEDLAAGHRQAMDNLAGKTRAVFTFLRAGQRRQIVLDYSRDYRAD